MDIEALAQRLDHAALTATATPQLEVDPAFDVGRAYEVQKASIARRMARGERLVGMKMGFTSRAKMAQMGVDDLICGRLTDAMLVDDGGEVHLGDYVHPRVEPEVAFLLKAPLSGRVSPVQAREAVAAVAPALEIIDSRYENFKFSLTDVVADNSSSAGFVVGPWARPEEDLSNLGLILSFDGRPEAFGSTAAILGHPLRSLVAAARMSATHGIELREGSIVLAGGATAASALRPNLYVSLEIERLGRVGFSVKEA